MCAQKGSDTECTCCRGTKQVPRRAVLEYKHCVSAGTSRVPTASELVQRVLAAHWACPGGSHSRQCVRGWDGVVTGHGTASSWGCTCHFLAVRRRIQ